MDAVLIARFLLHVADTVMAVQTVCCSGTPMPAAHRRHHLDDVLMQGTAGVLGDPAVV